MILTSEDVREILHLLDASSAHELHLHTERFKLALRRGGDGGWTEEMRVHSPADVLPPAVKPGAAEIQAGVAGQTKPALEVEDGQADVRAPLIGHFYRASKPGAPPFVDIGGRVETNTVVAIIETMKLMNSVYAGCCGTVVEIFYENGQFVEEGAVLMRVQGDGA